MEINGMMLFALQQTSGAAQDGGGFGGGMFVNYLILIGLLFAVFYFLVFRPEKKRKAKLQDMINSLKPGDKIVTIGGIHGTVSGVTDTTVVMRIADQVKIEVNRQAVATVITPQEATETSDSK